MRETSTAPLIGWSRAFPATPAQVREARQFLTGILDGHPATDDAVLCLSELVTNATIHSRSREPGGHFRVRAERHGSRVRVEVTDQGGPWAQSRRLMTTRTGAAFSSSPSWPELRAHRGRAGGVDGLVRDRRVTTGQDSATARGPSRRITRPAQPQTFILDGQRLRQLRRQRGLSQEELADQAGVSLTTVARLERQAMRALPWPYPRPTRPGPRRAPSHHHTPCAWRLASMPVDRGADY